MLHTSFYAYKLDRSGGIYMLMKFNKVQGFYLLK